jgi:hypothetical protein
MMECAENRSGLDPHAPGENMANARSGSQSRRWLRAAGAEAGLRAAAMIKGPPDAKNPPQMLLPDGNPRTQALATEAPEQALTNRHSPGVLGSAVRRLGTPIAVRAASSPGE